MGNTAFAGGPVHGAKAAAMGGAFVAVADDPSAILHNPAGLTNSKGTNIYSGATLVIPSSEYQSPSGLSEDSKFQAYFPPHLYLSSDFHTDNMVFGLGLLSPFGIGGLSWSEQGLTRYAATEGTTSTLAVNPTGAWQVTPWLSVGVGFYYQHAFVNSAQMVDQSAMGVSDAKLSMKVNGGGWGYDLGILLFQGEKVSLGCAYRSSATTYLSGTATLERLAPMLQSLLGGSEFKTSVESSLEFPQVVSMGIAYRPTPAWTLALDAEWLGWSSFGKMTLNLKDEVPAAGISDTTIALLYRDIWDIKFGLEYKVND
ncbi:MAG TPA: hypothetical protein DCE18_01750, partial [Syntrophobacteraceae bacterium]|nr:hypothetical protein [Syntrophobacteraceae bacterium]